MDDRLHKFSRLAEIGNYTKAAKELHISQPALTISIQKLERELDVLLFNRSGRRLELTNAGQLVYKAALEHQDVANHLADSLRNLARKRPTITIGMIDSVADSMCMTAAFDALEKIADVTVIVNNSRYLRESIEQRRIDFALIIDDGLEHTGLSSSLIGHESLQLVYAPQIESTVLTSLQKKQLHNFISYDKPSSTYRHIQRAFTDQGIRVYTTLFSSSPSVMLRMVLRSKGCAVLPEHMVGPHIKDGRLMNVLEPVMRPIALVTTSTKIFPGFAHEFIQEARKMLGT